MVKQVWIVILDEAEEVREKGECVRGKGDWWTYHTTASVTGSSKVVVRAEDLPGHVMEKTKRLN